MKAQINPMQPEIPKEAKEKLDAMKEKLDKFSKAITKENKEIIGVALLPPSKINPEEKLPEEEIKKLRNAINVLILVDLSGKKDWFELREALNKKIAKKAKEIDENLTPQLTDIYEIRESCFDGKPEMLELIAASAPLYDPKDLLGALKIAEVHKNMVLKKFEKYIVSYVAVGSLFRGDAKPNDIDVAVVVDDTDVKKMTRAELKDKLGAIVRSLGYDASKITGVEKAFHIQTYILTDFWDSIKDAHPVIFTFLRDGVPIYDRGVFMPWKLLLKMGRIKPSPEAIDMQMDIGEKLIQRTKGKLLSVVGEDLYYAILNPAQAALMLYGIAPPTPKETIQLMDEIFVKKEKLLEKKYVDMLDRIRKYYKDIEHGDVKEISGTDIDKLLTDAEDYLKRIKKLFDQIQNRRDKESVDEMYTSCLNVTEEVLKVHEIKIKSRDEIPQLFKKNILDKKHLPEKLFETLKLVTDSKERHSKKKIPSPELEKIRKEARSYIKTLVEYIQRKRGYELERAKIRFKYGEKFGEVILLDKIAFVIDDLDSEEKAVHKLDVKQDGTLSNKQKSTFEEFEKEISTAAMPSKVFIKEKIFESLRSLYGKDIEILINY